MKRLLTLCILGLCISAHGQTTVPTTQITLEYSSGGQARTAKIILSNDVLARLQANTATEADFQAVLGALRVAVGDVFSTVDHCSQPYSQPITHCKDRP